MEAIIIGGGASGISCAIKIKQNNPEFDVTVIEHLDSPCKKIFATGNGRCNLTNTNACGFNITRDFFDSLGLIMREESDGRMYPYSNRASSVVDILINSCEKLGVKIVTECTIKSVEKSGNIYIIDTNKGTFKGEYLVLAAGGKSQNALGSDGSGYALARVFSHTITKLQPALVQLKSSSKYCRTLKGLRSKCNVKIEINGEIAAEEYGEVLFTDYGISGIVIMNLSQYVNDDNLKKDKDKCIAIIDFVPDLSENDLIEHINKFGGLEGILEKRLCSVLSKQAQNDPQRIAKYAKNWRIIITGTKGFDFAQITKGGVSTNELKHTNESKLCENLYITGEMTDNQFICGGYNLNYAFVSGITAANDITGKEYDKN